MRCRVQLNAELMYAELSHAGPAPSSSKRRVLHDGWPGARALPRLQERSGLLPNARRGAERHVHPGSVFDYQAYVRIVLTLPADLLREAAARIRDFCSHHYRLATPPRRSRNSKSNFYHSSAE